MSGSFEEFLGSSEAAADAGKRRALALRDEMRRVAPKTSASLRECTEALRKRDVQPDVGLVDYRYSVRPAGLRKRSIGVDTVVLADRAGWLLSDGSSQYALDTEGELWVPYSVRAGVQGIAGRDREMSKYWPLHRNAERWAPRGFARLDLAAEAERAELQVYDSGHVSSPSSHLLPEVATAEWPLYASVYNGGVRVYWRLQDFQLPAGLEIEFYSREGREDLVAQVFKDVRDKLRQAP